MSLAKAKTYLSQFGLENKILEFSTSSATVELAAVAVGCQPARICKTLSFKVGDTPILILAAGDVKIDNHRFKEHFGVKAKMLPAEEVEPLIGHAIGGVCPFGINAGVEVYLDKSLQRFTTVFPACGSDNSAIEMTMEELERYSGYREWVDISKC